MQVFNDETLFSLSNSVRANGKFPAGCFVCHADGDCGWRSRNGPGEESDNEDEADGGPETGGEGGVNYSGENHTYEAHPSGQADPETKSMHEHKNLQHKECRTPARMEKSKRTEGFATSHELLQDGPVPRPTSWDAMGYPPQIRLVPQSMLNAYHPLICRHTDSHQCYAPGDFVVAFPRLVDLSDAVAEALISAALHTAITSIPTDLAAPYMQEWNTQQATTRYTQVTNGHCSYTRDKIGDDQPMQSGN
eukprot:GHVT01093958.1.p1 GENE.GHVT01093958.1~~GHVT01093958.1.p1  ORF type:complete len:249 (-),score=22.20 GHVT01093958.1:807-1553(-)